MPIVRGFQFWMYVLSSTMTASLAAPPGYAGLGETPEEDANVHGGIQRVGEELECKTAVALLQLWDC